MGSAPLIGLMDHAVYCGVTQHDRQCGERHCQWKKGARLLREGENRTGILIRCKSWSWEDALMKRRPNHVCRRAKVATASLKKRPKLRAVALSPGTRIQAHEQVSESGIHKASSLSSPALVNCCRVVRFARRTRTPSAVMR